MPLNTEKLEFRITGDSRGFKNAVNQSEKSVNGFQSRLKGLASTMKLAFAAAGVAMAGAAIKSALTFDRSMTKIKSLVGIASDEVDAMGKTAMKMASQTGRSATEAADALFFITSAGLRGAEAMDVLEASLKASAIGLGETKNIADVTTSAINAYGSETLSASEATDVMVATVREGKLEASELASSMGRVLPIASQMGVSFNEVGAAFASMSRTGTNAAEASTAIRGILVGLLKPTKLGEDALKGMNLTYKGLRKQLKEEGLLSLLNTLKENFEGNADAQQAVFSNTRALTGVMDLLGKGINTTRDIFTSLNDVLGVTNTQFEIVEQSASQRLDKALSTIGNRITNFFLPPLELSAFMINKLGEAFTFLSKVGGPSEDLKRQIDANTKSLKEFTLSGKQASRQAKIFFSAQSLFGDSLIKKEEKDDPLLTNILISNSKQKKSPVDKEIDSTKKLSTNFQELKPILHDIGEGFNIATLELREYLDVQDNATISQQKFAMISNIVTTGMNLMFEALSNPEGFSSFIKGIKQVIIQLLKQLAIMAAIAAIFALVTGKSFVDVFKSVSGLGKPSEGFKMFADGGIVTSPTIGMVGEAGSEAIIPLSKLPQMMGAMGGGNSNGQFTLRGQDLILALERAGNFKARITG
jgi:TP901 family phage tail tape measure protein